MAALTTTHRHDYHWPKADCLVPRAEAPNSRCEVKPGDCGKATKPWCGMNPPPPLPPREPLECNDLVQTPGNRPWCVRGPLVQKISTRPAMAPARVRTQPEGCQETPPVAEKPWCDKDGEPRIVSARVGAAPQQDISRYDQPNQYLRKLCDKYPRPTAVVTATPRDELTRRVYADRYRTTYQTDYCKNADDTAREIGECDTFNINNNYINSSNKNHAMEGVNAGSQIGIEYVNCKCGCGCRVARSVEQASAGDGPRIRPLACRPAAVSHNVHFSCCTPKKSKNAHEEVGPPEKIPPWISEYSDSIGRTGQLIIDQKLLYPQMKRKM